MSIEEQPTEYLPRKPVESLVRKLVAFLPAERFHGILIGPLLTGEELTLLVGSLGAVNPVSEEELNEMMGPARRLIERGIDALLKHPDEPDESLEQL